MRKIANTAELQARLRSIQVYATTELPSRERIAQSLHALADALQTKTATGSVLEAATNVAKTIVKNINESYEKPLISAAKEYLAAVEKGDHEECSRSAEAILEELEVDQHSHELAIRVNKQYQKVFTSAVGEHFHLSVAD